MAEALRQTGIEILRDVPWGTHICHFYRTQEELTEILVPYFKTAIENNELAVWAASPPVDGPEAVAALKKVVPDIDRHIAAGNVRILAEKEWNVREEIFSPKSAPSTWLEKTARVLAKGYKGAMLACSVPWNGKYDWKTIVDYEEALQTVIGNYPVIAICSYSVDKCDIAQAMDIVQNHRFALIKGEEGWKLIKSFELERARAELADYAQEMFEKSQTLSEKVEELTATNKTLDFERKQFLSILEGIDHPIYVADPETYEILYVNNALKKAFAEDAIGKKCYEHLQGLRGPCEFCTNKQILDNPEKTVVWEWQNLQNKRWYRCYDRAIRLPSGKAGRFEVAIDITEQKQKERALQDALMDFQSARESTPFVAAQGFDRTGVIRHWNTASAKLYGFAAEEAVGRRLQDVLLTGDAVGEFEQTLTRVWEAKEATPVQEWPVHTRGGEVRWVMSTMFPILREGVTVEVYCMDVDITDRKKTEERLKESLARMEMILNGTVKALAAITEQRVPYAAGHQRRVAQLACAIGKELGLPEDRIEAIRLASILHDIGNVYVPSEIVNKPGKLTKTEYGLVKTHSDVAHGVLKMVDFPWPIARIVLQHHERLDGSGYPGSLKNEEILLEARVLAVADVVEAMTAYRPYRPAHSVVEALEEIRAKKGIAFDENVVGACLRLFLEHGFRFEGV
ncbi:MAG: MEDS domain-containing protein [Planctomycetota bacterium]|nr:MEDS domain-containing protein [Planctomycetota bacterium]